MGSIEREREKDRDSVSTHGDERTPIKKGFIAFAPICHII
jgi:hypothetical protein